MTYTLRTTDGASLPITAAERDKVAKAVKDGKRMIYIGDSLIMTNCITGIYEPDAHEQKEGVLHDGTKVIKQFGQWVDAANPKVHLDPAYYPEIASDTVVSREAFKELGAGAYSCEKRRHLESPTQAEKGMKNSLVL